MIDDAITTLAESITQQQCVLFLGNDFPNLNPSNPTNKNLLDKLKQTRNYVGNDLSFLEAIKIKSIIEGQSSVIDFVRENSRRTIDNPKNIYSEITKLPFGSIISTTFDNQIENALSNAKIPHYLLGEDADVYMNYKPSLPLVKIFGSLSQGKLRISLDEVRDLFRDNSLLGQYIKVLCANKLLLFMGFRLDDKDFFNFFTLLNREFGPHRGLTFIVTNSSRQFDIDLWSRQQARVVISDSVDFLQKLNIHILLSKSSPSASKNIEDKIWIDNPFFRPLFYVRTLPSVNQVVDGILAILLQILENEDEANLEDTGNRIIRSIDQIARFRPNYASLKKLTGQIEYLFPPHKKTSIDELKIEIEKIASTRKQVRLILGEKGAHLLAPNDKVLLYSQSTCVNAVIKTWLDRNKGKTRKAEIILPEIRPKSPLPFQDALATIQSISLSDPAIPVVLIPDASIAHMIQSGRVDKVIMGVDKIYENNENGQERFIVTNVTGTLNIVVIAMDAKIPVYFISEEDKIYQRNLMNELATQFKPEEKIISENNFQTTPDNDYYYHLFNSEQISFYNPGYDEVDSEKYPFIIITEKREIRFKNNKRV